MFTCTLLLPCEKEHLVSLALGSQGQPTLVAAYECRRDVVSVTGLVLEQSLLLKWEPPHLEFIHKGFAHHPSSE